MKTLLRVMDTFRNEFMNFTHKVSLVPEKHRSKRMLTGTETYRQPELFQLRYLASRQTFQHRVFGKEKLIFFFTEDRDAQRRIVGPDLRSSQGSRIGSCVTHVSFI